MACINGPALEKQYWLCWWDRCWESNKVSRILGEMGSKGWVDTVKVHGGMILVGAGYDGYNVLTKAALTGGVDPFVYSTYRDAIGCMALFVYALDFERCHQS